MGSKPSWFIIPLLPGSGKCLGSLLQEGFAGLIGHGKDGEMGRIKMTLWLGVWGMGWLVLAFIKRKCTGRETEYFGLFWRKIMKSVWEELMERYCMRHSGGISNMAAEFTVWDIKKELKKKLMNYQQIITKPWEWKYMSYGRWTTVFNNPDRESSFIYSVELFQDPSFFLWGEKQKTTIKKSKQNKKSNTTFSSNTVFNLISSSPFSFNSDNHSSQRKEAGTEFELNSKRISQ